MLFSKNAVVTDLWTRKLDFKKAKLTPVQGRDFHSLSLRLSGKVWFEVNGKQYLSEENCITFIPKGTEYKTQVLSSGSRLLVHFDTKDLDALAKPMFFKNNDAEVRKLFFALCENRQWNTDKNYEQMSLFYSLLAAVDNLLQIVPRRMRLAKFFIDQNYAEEISIAKLALDAEMSEVHFRNEFKKYFGTSPLSYLKKVRIDNAKRLLYSGHETVSNVAINCGFDSVSYFSYEFKRLTGKTPTQYLGRGHYIE